jgi:hypothetical protein
MIAALYVAQNGCYYGLPGVEPWGLPDRDAREYAGPWPVVAHPPCARWGGSGSEHRAELGDTPGAMTEAASRRRWRQCESGAASWSIQRQVLRGMRSVWRILTTAAAGSRLIRGAE